MLQFHVSMASTPLLLAQSQVSVVVLRHFPAELLLSLFQVPLVLFPALCLLRLRLSSLSGWVQPESGTGSPQSLSLSFISKSLLGTATVLPMGLLSVSVVASFMRSCLS